MQNRPLVSIILPAFNCELYINQAIESILSQSYTNWELLICDDASNDNTQSIILKYCGDNRIRFFVNKKNKKLLQTRNYLLQQCQGDFITFQDADDYSHSDRLQLMVKEFTKYSALGLISCQVGYIDRRGNLIRVSHNPLNYSNILDSIYYNNVIGGSMMMIKRSALEEVGFKFREYFDGLSYQDYDLSTLIAQKYEVFCLPQVLYYYRQLETSASKIIDHRRILAKEIVIYLSKQRRDTGTDDLIDGNIQVVDEYFQQLEVPFKLDPSLVYRKYAANFMYSQFFLKAILTSWQAIKVKPFKIINWMTLQYCLRKSMISLLRRAIWIMQVQEKG